MQLAVCLFVTAILQLQINILPSCITLLLFIYMIHKTRQNKKRSYKKRTGDLWNTRRESQIQRKLDQPSRKNGQRRSSETRPELQTSREKRSWTPQETMATLRCRNRSSELIHGERWWCSVTLLFFYWRYNPLWVVFCSPLAGYGLLACEVSWSNTTTRQSR